MIRKIALTTTALFLMMQPGFAQDGFSLQAEDIPAVQPGTPEEEAVKTLILKTLAENPEVLISALNEINAQQVEARAKLEAKEARIRTIAANEIQAPVFGNPDGDLTIIAFVDYNCPHCRTAHAIIKDVVESDGNIRLVMRDLPLLGPDSTYAAKAALAADMQGKYQIFHDKMMSLSAPADVNAVLKVALESGIDLNKMMLDLDKEGPARLIEDTKKIAEEFDIEGTPFYFVGMGIGSGAPTKEQLLELIQSERAKVSG